LAAVTAANVPFFKSREIAGTFAFVRAANVP
jgi:hypothetical protein